MSEVRVVYVLMYQGSSNSWWDPRWRSGWRNCMGNRYSFFLDVFQREWNDRRIFPIRCGENLL